MAYHALGRQAESDAALADLIEKYEKTMQPTTSPGVCVSRRSRPRLRVAGQGRSVPRSVCSASIAVYPMFDNLHSDPRWLPFLRKLGMAPEQLAAIKFDVKVPNQSR